MLFYALGEFFLVMNQDDKKKRSRGLVGHGIVDYLPDPFVRVLVHTEAHTCQAYLDRSRIWRHAFGDKPITSRVISWEPI